MEIPKILEQDTFDLILTDLKMPGMDRLVIVLRALRPVKKAILIYVGKENKIYNFDSADYIRAESLIPDSNETVFINKLKDILTNCLLE